jgi:hypothetical protein
MISSRIGPTLRPEIGRLTVMDLGRPAKVKSGKSNNLKGGLSTMPMRKLIVEGPAILIFRPSLIKKS